MKIWKLLLSLFLSLAVFYGLNTQFGTIPPLGKFLNPTIGFWQNELSEGNNNELQIEGLTDDVSVIYDDELIPHIFAQNDLDLYKAQGFVTAQNRLWQMEFQTHAAGGQLSEIVGADAIEYDREQRRKGMVFGAEKALETMEESPETMKAIEAYRDGINAYISSLQPSDFPVEYKLLDYAPEPWTLKKTALLLMYMTDMLAGGDSDFEYTNLLKKYGKETFDLLFPDFFEVQDPVIPQERDWSDWDVNIPAAPETYQATDLVADLMEKPHPDNGSNNWAVGPDKSYSGNPILANDPHLGLNLPSIWYVLQLHSPNQNVFGASLPGAAGIVIGFNNNISWGVTNATRDVKDWYKIQFRDDSNSEYLYAGEWNKVEKRIEEIKIKGEDSYYDTVSYTHHGPISYDGSFGSDNERVGFAMKWTGHLGGNNQRSLMDLNKAQNYDEYVAALEHFAAPAQNFIFSSTDGDIALWVNGKFPNKWEEQGKFVLDGSNPEHDWQGFIPHEHNAHVKNPERGFVSSANQHPTDETYPYYVFNDGYETYRNRVINDFFRSKEQFDIQDFKDLHNNNYNLKAAELLPTMVEQMNKSSLNAQEILYLTEVRSWDFYNDIEKEGPTIWERWWIQVRNMVWDELAAEDFEVDYPMTYQTIHLLKNEPNLDFMDIQETPEKETAQDLFLLSFKKAVEELERIKSRNGDLTWGEYKGTYVGHLLQGLPAFSRFDLSIGGNSGIVNATSKNHGPSWRMIVEMTDPPTAFGIYPGGQSGNPGSKFYDNYIDRWAAGEYIGLEFMQSEEDLNNPLFIQTIKPQK